MLVRAAGKQGACRVASTTVVHQSKRELRVPDVTTTSIVTIRTSELQMSHFVSATKSRVFARRMRVACSPLAPAHAGQRFICCATNGMDLGYRPRSDGDSDAARPWWRVNEVSLARAVTRASPIEVGNAVSRELATSWSLQSGPWARRSSSDMDAFVDPASVSGAGFGVKASVISACRFPRGPSPGLWFNG